MALHRELYYEYFIGDVALRAVVLTLRGLVTFPSIQYYVFVLLVTSMRHDTHSLITFPTLLRSAIKRRMIVTSVTF